MTSHGNYALVAGTERFIAAVRTFLAHNQEDVLRAFVSDWREMERGDASVAWVPTLLEHVLGAEGLRLWAASA